ncbi:MAG: hypothetical protein KDK70_12360 [Myxococcales bacterium]|nr:hypothetical protein [Myxococcales bacterium]
MSKTPPPWSSRIGPGPRPWTDAGLAATFDRPSRDPARSVFYADSAARDQLARALVRYVKREVSGASYLLAADPGTGKTTTVEWVVQQLYAECLGPHSTFQGHRPLLVRLYGPNLAPVRDPPPGALAEVKDEGKDKDGAAAHRRYPPVLQLLRDMAVSLFEAVLAEIERTITLQLLPEQQATAVDLELFLQLRHEMRRGPVVADLMAYWERLGWGEHGAFSREPTSRGAAEVAVLQDLAEARLAVVSEARDKRDTKGSSDAERSMERSVQPADLLKTSTAIIAGAAAAAGLVADGSWVLAGLAGPLITAGVGAGLSFSNRLTRRQSRQDERAYILKADVESLIHRIPRLLQGLRKVGLHPVFVIDELDKVDPELVTYLVDNLKTQVTEQSFFCFLTDADSTSAEDRDALQDHHVAHLHFWDRIYLFQTTAALHGYLRVFLSEEQAERDTQHEAVAVLRHILLLRAEHHPLQLHRELDRARREGLFSRIDEDPAGVLRDPALRLRLRFALATEWAMAELAAEINNDPRRLQLAKDVLYRPWRSWRHNEERCTLTRLEIYKEVREATGDRDFAGHVAGALDTLLDQLADTGFSSAGAPDDVRTRAYLALQCPPARLASEPVLQDACKRTIEAHAHPEPLIDRDTGRWLERPAIVQELDIEHRLQQLATTPCIEVVGGLQACLDVLFDEPPAARAVIVQREQDVIAVAFLARLLAVSLEQTHARALQAAGLLVAGAVRITRETIERLGRYLLVDDLDDLVEAADASSLEARLKARGPLDPEVFDQLEATWHDDWARRLLSPRNEEDRGSILDPIAELRDWPRRALWRWRQPAAREPGPERSIALWSELLHSSFAGELPLAFGVLALKQLGLTPQAALIEQARESLRGSESTRRRFADAMAQRRPAPNRLLQVDTRPGGVGEQWVIDAVYPTLLLDTNRRDTEDLRRWLAEHVEPTAEVLRFGRMNLDFVSAADGLAAYILEQGHLKNPDAPDRLVISDPGSPRAIIDLLATGGSSPAP